MATLPKNEESAVDGQTSSLKSRDGKLNNRVLSASRDPDRFPAGSLHFPLEEHASCPAVQMTKKEAE